MPRRPSLAVHWFRHRDLRLYDHPSWVYAHTQFDAVLPLFCFDTKTVFGAKSKTRFNSLKVSPRRAQFLIDSVANLRRNLTQQNSTLLVAHGDPVDSLDALLRNIHGLYNVHVVVQDEVAQEECTQVERVAQMVQQNYQGSMHCVWGSTLFMQDDLPFDDSLKDMPNVFTEFCDKVQVTSFVRKPLPIPSPKPPPHSTFERVAEWERALPQLQDLGYTDTQIESAKHHDKRGAMTFQGGETAALTRLEDYLWTNDCLSTYFDTRNGMLCANDSTKLSPWLAHGCVSPRHVAYECHRYENERVKNPSTYYLVYELIWRDYCKLFSRKHGHKIFLRGGTIDNNQAWSMDPLKLAAWKNGQTGYPIVDANMRELRATGFMSNRGRQIVASFLINDLDFDWRYGADYFESQLLDYDVYNNWVNWLLAAGMTGGRRRWFGSVNQSKNYDQHGEYVRHWLPELKDLPNELVHEPWKMTVPQQLDYNVQLGVNYPGPIIVSGLRVPRDGRRPRPLNRNPTSNRHQKYQMKSPKLGTIQWKD